MTAPDRKNLPLTDYDELPESTLRERVRGLTEEQLRQVLDYESEHAKRPAVTAVLRTRLDDLAHGATPTASPAEAARPGPHRAPDGGSRVTPATAASPTHAPPHGSPAQPARPKGNQSR